jgi:hypothetical protein
VIEGVAHLHQLVVLASSMSSTTVTAPPGPTLASGDPNNPMGLLVGIITTLVVAVGALLLYLRHRRPTSVDSAPGRPVDQV